MQGPDWSSERGYRRRVELTFALFPQLWAGGFALVDLLVTISLVMFLRARIANFNARSDSMLRQLGWLAIQSSSYTAVFAITGA